jgi:TetR/AcrR family transcriptional regulator, transcriptional repressor for nem operon
LQGRGQHALSYFVNGYADHVVDAYEILIFVAAQSVDFGCPPTICYLSGHTHRVSGYNKLKARPAELQFSVETARLPLTPQRASYMLVGMLVKRRLKVRMGRLRDPGQTRQTLLQAAFREFHRSGFQSTDLGTILAATGVTKGALYHHFDSKQALGYAIVEEIIAASTRNKWVLPLRSSADPIETLICIVQRTSVRSDDVRNGCPLLNLAQEMSSLDEKFRKRLAKVFHEWQKSVASALLRGQNNGTVRRDVDAIQTASFFVATFEGYVLLARNARDLNQLKAGLRNIVRWLRSLRPTKQRTRKNRK